MSPREAILAAVRRNLPQPAVPLPEVPGTDRKGEPADASLDTTFSPGLWNQGRTGPLFHIDAVRADIDRDYRPQVELTGDVGATFRALATQLEGRPPLAALRSEFNRRAGAELMLDFPGVSQ
jgi:hypothetical protein